MKKVHRDHVPDVIIEELPPRLGRWLSVPDHVLGNRGFGNLDAQLHQLAMNTRRTPARVVAAHHSNQVANLFGHSWPTRLSTADLPPPEQTEALAVPRDNRLGLHNHQHGFPVGPHVA